MRLRFRWLTAAFALLPLSAVAGVRIDYQAIQGNPTAAYERIELSAAQLRIDMHGMSTLANVQTGEAFGFNDLTQEYWKMPMDVSAMMATARQAQAAADQISAQMGEQTAVDFGIKPTPYSIVTGLTQLYRWHKDRANRQSLNAAEARLQQQGQNGGRPYLETRTQKLDKHDEVNGIACTTYRRSTNGLPSRDFCFAKPDALGLSPADTATLVKALELLHAKSTTDRAASNIHKIGDPMPYDELVIKSTQYDSHGEPVFVNELKDITQTTIPDSDFEIPQGYTQMGAAVASAGISLQRMTPQARKTFEESLRQDMKDASPQQQAALRHMLQQLQSQDSH